MNRNEHSAAGSLPAIMIAASDYPRLQALAEAAARSVPQVGDYLSRELERASVVDEAATESRFVRVGSLVTYRDSVEGAERTVRLVWPLEADVARSRISVLSLVGAALLGMRAGQSIEWPSPFGGARRLQVIKVHG